MWLFKLVKIQALSHSVIFQVFNSYMWLVATILDNT